LPALQRVIAERSKNADPGSGTTRLFADAELLKSKLVEEATELADADTSESVRHELADLLYFALVAAERGGVSLDSAVKELKLRHRRVSRRPMKAKTNEEQS
jgi:phosphoribosyl-ATP pyrophosphohydrolase/phosphoribosyl-AMP cyclohydrolase/histidinol dehydrogenase